MPLRFEFTGQVVKMLEDDFTRPRPITVGELNQPGSWFRFDARAARLTAPVQYAGHPALFHLHRACDIAGIRTLKTVEMVFPPIAD